MKDMLSTVVDRNAVLVDGVRIVLWFTAVSYLACRCRQFSADLQNALLNGTRAGIRHGCLTVEHAVSAVSCEECLHHVLANARHAARHGWPAGKQPSYQYWKAHLHG